MVWLYVALPVAGYLVLRYIEEQLKQQDPSSELPGYVPIVVIGSSLALAYIISR